MCTLATPTGIAAAVSFPLDFSYLTLYASYSFQQRSSQTASYKGFFNVFHYLQMYQAFASVYHRDMRHPSQARAGARYLGRMMNDGSLDSNAGQSVRYNGSGLWSQPQRRHNAPVKRKLYRALEVVQGCSKKVKKTWLMPRADVPEERVEERALTVDVKPGGPGASNMALKSENGYPQRPTVVDVVFVVPYKPHPFFKRQGADIYYLAKVPIGKVLRGANVQVPTLTVSRI
ncbi:hypothetical protein HPB50_010190 [Hyalomma asiaticum]|uniref:Uncharacterized protein n=1 Tax=Hyalomma asiaticum TaxID=266040 RepID=A0ACB7TIJ1_HYAAI|nr:hypothetical protein HPB50_010190 [Hyalomma asiaticum]